jgi:hypothetical protein
MARTPMMAMVRMSRADRGPTVSLATAGLMAELDRCHSGEDGHITIERHCKRRRNLKRDFGPPATAPTGHATRTPSSPRAVGGCIELAPHLHMVVWPHKSGKKVGIKDKPLAGAPTAVATTAGGGRGPRGDKRPHQAYGSDDGGVQCLVHNSRCHNTEECLEIKKLAEQFCKQQKH